MDSKTQKKTPSTNSVQRWIMPVLCMIMICIAMYIYTSLGRRPSDISLPEFQIHNNMILSKDTINALDAKQVDTLHGHPDIASRTNIDGSNNRKEVSINNPQHKLPLIQLVSEGKSIGQKLEPKSTDRESIMPDQSIMAKPETVNAISARTRTVSRTRVTGRRKTKTPSSTKRVSALNVKQTIPRGWILGVEDQCQYMHFQSRTRPTYLFASFPGSGNGWTMHLLQLASGLLHSRQI